MAISEETKISVKRRRDEITSLIDKNDKEIAEHEAVVKQIEAQNTALKAERDALANDIPAPTVQAEAGPPEPAPQGGPK